MLKKSSRTYLYSLFVDLEFHYTTYCCPVSGELLVLTFQRQATWHANQSPIIAGVPELGKQSKFGVFRVFHGLKFCSYHWCLTTTWWTCRLVNWKNAVNHGTRPKLWCFRIEPSGAQRSCAKFLNGIAASLFTYISRENPRKKMKKSLKKSDANHWERVFAKKILASIASQSPNVLLTLFGWAWSNHPSYLDYFMDRQDSCSRYALVYANHRTRSRHIDPNESPTSSVQIEHVEEVLCWFSDPWSHRHPCHQLKSMQHTLFLSCFFLVFNKTLIHCLWIPAIP